MYSLPVTSQTCPALPEVTMTSCETLPKPPPGRTRRASSVSARCRAAGSGLVARGVVMSDGLPSSVGDRE